MSNDYGETWVEKSVEKNWNSIAMSASGKYQSACQEGDSVYVSNDFGESWEPIQIIDGSDSPQDAAISITMIANGKVQLCLSKPLLGSFFFPYISFDYGQTWEDRSRAPYSPFDTTRPFFFASTNITINTDGSKMLLISDDHLYISENLFYSTVRVSDNIPYITDLPSTNWTSISTSLQSEYTILTCETGAYLSDDFLVTINQIPDISGNATCSCISASGQYQVIGVSNDYLYISEDYGHTWNTRGTIEKWAGVSMSSFGQYITAVANGATIKVSLNSAK